MDSDRCDECPDAGAERVFSNPPVLVDFCDIGNGEGASCTSS